MKKIINFMKKIIQFWQIIDRHLADFIRRNAFRGILDIKFSQRFYIVG